MMRRRDEQEGVAKDEDDGSEASGRLQWQGREWRLAQFRLKWINKHGDAARLEAARDDMMANKAPGPGWKGAKGNRGAFKVLASTERPPTAQDVGRRTQAAKEAAAGAPAK